jgi:4a-hydroxytetrahydrobiopterin dehydratase
MPPLATQSEIQSFLERNQNWSGSVSGLCSQFTAPSFVVAIDLVNSVAVIAEKIDHHPDIDIRWNTVSFAVSTHSAGGVTSLDFELATAIDSLAHELFDS